MAQQLFNKLANRLAMSEMLAARRVMPHGFSLSSCLFEYLEKSIERLTYNMTRLRVVY